jgi:SAM-dependent methyltransferase
VGDDAPVGTVRFDTEGMFDEDYLYFYVGYLTDGQADADADLIWRLLDLRPGLAVLDLGCGHGRIANRLAERGCEVTGLDVTPMFLDLARADAAVRGVTVEYRHGDMRDLPWQGRFDRVVSWFTSYGYFDDAGNRTVLRQAARALKPGGRALFDLNHRDWIVRNFQPHRVVERDGDLMVDRSTLDPLTGRADSVRTFVRGGRVRSAAYSVRLFNFPELRDWLLDAGFTAAHAHGDEGAPLEPDSRRLLVTADT